LLKKLLRNPTHFVGQVSFTLATNIVINAIGLTTGVLAARLLGPEGRGELAAIQMWGAFVATLSLLGLPDAVLYLSGREPQRAGAYWISGSVCALAWGTVALLAGYGALPWVLGAQSVAVVSTTRWYAVGLFVLFTVNWIPLSVLRGCGHIAVWNMLRLLPQVGWLFVLVIAILDSQVTPRFLAVGFLVSYALTAGVTLPKAMRSIAPPYTLDMKLWPQMIRFGLPSVTGDVPGYLLQGGRLAQLFVAAVLDPAALGYLAVGVAIGNVMRMIPEAVSSVVFPRVAAASPEDKASELAKGTRTTVFCIVISVSVALLLCPWLVPLVFGESFASATHLSMIMVISGGIEGLKVVLNGGLRGLGRPSSILQGELLAIAFTMGGLSFFLHHLGIEGVGVALVLGNVVSVFFLLRAVTLATRESLWSFLAPSIADFRPSENLLKNYQN
jgi:O-antigen/teichoic acid export membrane protein